MSHCARVIARVKITEGPYKGTYATWCDIDEPIRGERLKWPMEDYMDVFGEDVDKIADNLHLPQMRVRPGRYCTDIIPAAVHEEVQKPEV